jgi:hypothetical protein
VRLDVDAGSRVRAIASSSGLDVDVGSSHLEFEYQGRDTNRFVERFLARVAEVVRDAEGEIRCESEPDGDPDFEFYRFEHGNLVRQRGPIVRGPVEIVLRP